MQLLGTGENQIQSGSYQQYWEEPGEKALCQGSKGTGKVEVESSEKNGNHVTMRIFDNPRPSELFSLIISYKVEEFLSLEA